MKFITKVKRPDIMGENGQDKDFKITQENISQVRRNGQSQERKPEKMDEEEAFYHDVNQQSARIQQLVEQIDAFPDPAVKSLLAECMEAVLTLHGTGLERIFDLIERSKGNGNQIKQNLLGDDFIKGMLLIHGLHPDDLETRLYKALDKVKPYMDSHGGSVKVISLENGVAKLKLEGSCDGCPSSVSTLELGIKEAIEEECPDLLGLEVEGLADNPLAQEIRKNNEEAKAGGSSNGTSNWTVVPNIGSLSNGQKQPVEVKDNLLMICKVDDQLYAYENKCPGCGMPMDTGTLENGELKCKLGHAFDVKKAGRNPDDPDIHLRPFPLLEENGNIKIAVE